MDVTAVFSLPPAGGGVGHSEAGSDRVCRPLCRDLQWRQQAQTLHSYCNDWLPCPCAAGELADDIELTYCLSFWVLCRDLSTKWSMDPDGRPYGFSQAWPQMFFRTGRQLCASIESGMNLRSLPYADADKDLVCVHMGPCSES